MFYPCLMAVHVFCAIVWGGGGIIGAFFLLPIFSEALGRFEPSERVRVAQVQRRYGLTLGVFAGLALLSGAVLMHYPLSQGWGYFRSAGGMELGLGVLVGLGAYVIGAGPLRRRFERVLALARSGAPLPELASEQARALRSSRVLAWHLVAAGALMAFHGAVVQLAAR